MIGDVSLAVAFAAGLLSFISPCVLALVPVYLAFLGQAAGDEPLPVGAHGTAAARLAVVPQALLFIGGFSLVFIVLGVTVGMAFRAVVQTEIVRQVVGLVVIGIGLASIGFLGDLMGRLRVGVDPSMLPAARSTRALGLGVLVAIGWTPCIGPVLGAIYMAAAGQSTLAAGVLLIAYSAGLAVPFLAVAVALPRLEPLLAFLRRHHRGVQVVTGLFIVGVGVLIYLNAFSRLAGLFTFVL